jgi:hypothetical protein
MSQLEPEAKKFLHVHQSVYLAEQIKRKKYGVPLGKVTCKIDDGEFQLIVHWFTYIFNSKFNNLMELLCL